MKPTYRKAWARILLMSNLTLGPSFKVKVNCLLARVLCLFYVYQYTLVLQCTSSYLKSVNLFFFNNIR